MAVLERSLHNEVKKRTEMTKSIKTWCDVQVAEMRSKFQQDVNERRLKLQERLDVERNRVHVHRESPPHVIGPFSQAIYSLLQFDTSLVNILLELGTHLRHLSIAPRLDAFSHLRALLDLVV